MPVPAWQAEWPERGAHRVALRKNGIMAETSETIAIIGCRGRGGMGHYLEHLGASQQRRWARLGASSLTPEVRLMLIESVAAEAAGRPIPEPEAARDDAITRVIAGREEIGHARG
jgi:hypothetical protein